MNGVAVTPDGKTAFVANQLSNTVSTIDVKTRTKNPTDIAVGTQPAGVKVTPAGNVPVCDTVGVGKPVVVTVNVPGVPTVKVVLAALVIAGACWTVNVKA